MVYKMYVLMFIIIHFLTRNQSVNNSNAKLKTAVSNILHSLAQ